MALSDKAKWHAVIGAIVVDSAFRNTLVTGDDAVRAQVINDYSNRYGLAISPPLRDQMVEDLLRKPCVNTIQDLLTSNQTTICPCWPCVALAV